MKKILITVCLVMLMSIGVSAHETPMKVLLNGDELELVESPIIENGTTLVPFRDVFEALGADVNWVPVFSMVQGIKDNTLIQLTLDSNIATVNDRQVTLTESARAINGVTLVPLRFVAESLGADVGWAGDTNTVTIDLVEEVDLYHPDYLEGLTEEEEELARLINEYRESLGKETFKISKSLTTVARYHVYDSNQNSPELNKDIRGIQGNLHSWSDQGHWEPVTYTPDHEYSKLLWSKPSELTNYTGSGHEISVRATPDVTPRKALEAWQNSPGHNDVITGSNGRGNLKVMGVAIKGNYSHVWFGAEEDPEGYYVID